MIFDLPTNQPIGSGTAPFDLENQMPQGEKPPILEAL
jgi:hypothetical protein